MFLRVGYLHMLYFLAVLNRALFSVNCSLLYRLKTRYGATSRCRRIWQTFACILSSESTYCFKEVFNTKLSVMLLKNVSKVGVLCEIYLFICLFIYILQLGCYPVAVIILHVYKTWNWLLINLSPEGLHEKHVVATWNVGNRLSICL